MFYLSVSWATRPVPHNSEISFPHPPLILEDIQNDSKDVDSLPYQDESSSGFSYEGHK